MMDGDLHHTASGHLDQGGQETMHTVETRQLTHKLSAKRLQRATRVGGVILQDTPAYAIGQPRRQAPNPVVLASLAHSGDQISLGTLQFAEQRRNVRRVVL